MTLIVQSAGRFCKSVNNSRRKERTEEKRSNLISLRIAGFTLRYYRHINRYKTTAIVLIYKSQTGRKINALFKLVVPAGGTAG